VRVPCGSDGGVVVAGVVVTMRYSEVLAPDPGSYRTPTYREYASPAPNATSIVVRHASANRLQGGSCNPVPSTRDAGGLAELPTEVPLMPRGPAGPASGPVAGGVAGDEGGGGGAPGTGAADPYLQGGWGSTLGHSRRRVARATYWQCRRYSQCIRDFVSRHYKGDQSGARYLDLWLIAESIDLCVRNLYLTGGTEAINHGLDTDDRLEHMLIRVGAEMNYQRTGDYSAYLELLTSKPGGDGDVLPAWSLNEGRDRAHQLHTQKRRPSHAGGGRHRSQSSSSSDKVGVRRRMRRKGKPDSKASGSGTNPAGSGATHGGGGGAEQEEAPKGGAAKPS